MTEFKLLHGKLIDGFLLVIEPIAKLLVSLRIHPHALTGSGFVFSLIAANFFRLGQFLYGGILVILAGICDVLDGRLARETQKISRFGALMDSTLDRYSEVVIYMGLAFYFAPLRPYIVLLIILAITGSFMVSYTRARAEGLGIECKIGMMQRPERITFLAAGAILGSLPYTHNFFMIFSLWMIAIFANITVVQRIVYIRQRLKSLDAGSL